MAAAVGYVQVAARGETVLPYGGNSSGSPGFDPMTAHTQSFQVGDGVVAMTVSGASVWLALANGAMEVRDAHSGCVLHVFAAPTTRRPSASTRIWCLLAIVDESAALAPGSHGKGLPSPAQHGEPQVWVGLSTGAIEVYHGESYTLLRQLRKHLSGVYCLAAEQSSAVDPRTRVVYSGSSDFQIAQWRICDGRLLRVLKGHANYVRCLYAEGAALVSGSDDGTVKVWDRDRGEVMSTGRFHLQANSSSSEAPSSGLQPQPQQHQHRSGVSVLCRVGVNMWSGDDSGTLIVWRLKDCVALLVSRPHTARITSLRKVGSQVYSGGADGVICVYAALDGTLTQRLQTNGGGVASARVMAVQCAVEVDRYYLWTGSADNTVRCWHHDEHIAMTEDRERFNDMRWYYATTQPYRESNEALLEQQRELTELVVLSNGSDDAVRTYLSRNNEENQSAAARYWTLESRVREAQDSTHKAEKEKQSVEASLALKRKALEVARANLQKLLDAEQALRSSSGTAPAAAPGAPTVPVPGAPAPPPTTQMPQPSLVPQPQPAAVGALSPLSAPPPPTTTTAIPLAAPAPPPATTTATPTPVIPSLAMPPVTAAPTATAVSAAPATSLPALGSTPPVPAVTAPAAPAAAPVATPQPAAVPAPTPAPAALPAVETAPTTTTMTTTTTTTTTTAAVPAPPTLGTSKTVTSASYEPDLSSLPPPPPPPAGPKVLPFAFPTPLAVVDVSQDKKASHNPLSASDSPAHPATAPTVPPPPMAPVPPIPSAQSTAPTTSATPFVVPPPPAAIVPQRPSGA